MSASAAVELREPRDKVARGQRGRGLGVQAVHEHETGDAGLQADGGQQVGDGVHAGGVDLEALLPAGQLLIEAAEEANHDGRRLVYAIRAG